MKVTFTERIRLMNLEKDIKELMEQLNRPMQSGFEYKDWPIIKAKGDCDIEIELAHWEFIPPWVKSLKEQEVSRKKFNMLNAIGEELFVKKSYKDAALKRRCLILSSGFYEWRHFRPENSKKDEAYPYYINLPGQEYFFIAGIWQPWTDRETGETMDTFALVTTKANSLMEQVHNKKRRMPTILPENLAFEWIQDGLSEQRITEIATYQIASSSMHAHPIHKEFRALEMPEQQFEYAELPALELSN